MSDRISNQHGPALAAPALRRPGWPTLFGVAALSILITLSAVEFGLRLYIDNLTPEARESRVDPQLRDLPGSARVYGLRPFAGPPVNSNSFGFRGEQVEQVKEPGVFRIAMLGDSITYGNSVDWNQTFSYVLQTQLNSRQSGMRVEVLNFGVSGYNTRQQLATLRELGLQFSPDLVVLNVCINDSDPVKHLYGLSLKNETMPLRWSDINIRTIVDSSYLLTLVKHRLGAILRSLGSDVGALNSPRLFLDSRVRETAWGEMKATMREIRDVTAGAGIPLVAVIYPYASQVRLSDAERVPQQDLVVFFAELGVPALDITPAYLDAPQRMFVDGYIHLSPYGHGVVAETMRGFLAGKSLLPASSASATTATNHQ